MWLSRENNQTYHGILLHRGAISVTIVKMEEDPEDVFRSLAARVDGHPYGRMRHVKSAKTPKNSIQVGVQA